VKAQRLEGLVAKRRDSRYESGLRSGSWQKMRVNRGQEFVIGGYTHGTKTFDALVFGVYEKGKLLYVARTRNGFTPATRVALMKKMKPLEIAECPFVNLPAARRALGAGAHQGQNGRVRLAQAGAGGAERISGVDRREPSAALEVRRPA
jgi:ATP-dependent DNA ligase